MQNNYVTNDPLYDQYKHHRELVRACFGGAYNMRQYVKQEFSRFVIKHSAPEGSDQHIKAIIDAKNTENERQADLFYQRATPIGATSITARVLISMMFSDAPTVDLNGVSEYLINSATQSNESLVDYAKKLAGLVAVDYDAFQVITFPPSDGPANRGEVSSGKKAGKFTLYSSDSVVRRGFDEKGKLVDVHCMEVEQEFDDPETRLHYKEVKYIRRFWIKNGTYTVTKYTENYSEVVEENEVKLDGQSVDYITGQFVGADDNSGNYGYSPLLRLADLERAHFIADAECAQSITNQNGVMVNVFTDMTASEFLEKNPDGIRAGAGAVNQFGQDDRVELLKGNDNPNAFKQKEDLFKMLVAAGAQLFVQANANTSEGTRKLDSMNVTAVITNMAQNINSAINNGIKMIQDYNGDSSEFTFEMSTKFADNAPDSAAIQTMLAAAIQGKLSDKDLLAGMLRAGHVSGTVEELEKNLLQQYGSDNVGMSEGLTDDD